MLRTDFQVISYLIQTKNLKSRLFRWSLLLQEYDFDIQYLKGTLNFLDFLSRSFTNNQIHQINAERDRPIPVLRDEYIILSQYHIISGHGSKETMKYLIGQRYNIKNLSKKVSEFCESCEICQKDSVKK